MFQIVDSAPLAPCGCMVCGSSKAPLLDLMQEFSGQQLRLYLCKTHAREIVRAFGWVKGERMDELDKAAEQIVGIEHARDEAQDAAHTMADELTRIQQRLTIVEKERDDYRDKVVGLAFRGQQVATQANELVIAANGS